MPAHAPNASELGGGTDTHARHCDISQESLRLKPVAHCYLHPLPSKHPTPYQHHNQFPQNFRTRGVTRHSNAGIVLKIPAAPPPGLSILGYKSHCKRILETPRCERSLSCSFAFGVLPEKPQKPKNPSKWRRISFRALAAVAPEPAWVPLLSGWAGLGCLWGIKASNAKMRGLGCAKSKDVAVKV